MMTIGTLDKALACNRNSKPNPNGMPNGSDRFQNSYVPNQVVRNSIVEPCREITRIVAYSRDVRAEAVTQELTHMPKSYPHGRYSTPVLYFSKCEMKKLNSTIQTM